MTTASGWGHACVIDPTHGRLIPWPHSDTFGWFCPSQSHDGGKGRPASRAFFTTAEAQSGVLAAIPPAPVAPPDRRRGLSPSRPAPEIPAATRQPSRKGRGSPRGEPDRARVETEQMTLQT